MSEKSSYLKNPLIIRHGQGTIENVLSQETYPTLTFRCDEFRFGKTGNLYPPGEAYARLALPQGPFVAAIVQARHTVSCQGDMLAVVVPDTMEASALLERICGILREYLPRTVFIHSAEQVPLPQTAT